MTALHTTLTPSHPLIIVIFGVGCYTMNEGLMDRTEHTMIVPFIVLDNLPPVGTVVISILAPIIIVVNA